MTLSSFRLREASRTLRKYTEADHGDNARVTQDAAAVLVREAEAMEKELGFMHDKRVHTYTRIREDGGIYYAVWVPDEGVGKTACGATLREAVQKAMAGIFHDV